MDICRQMFSKYKYHIVMHLVVLLWGFTGILGKKINLEAVPLVWYRVLIAGVGIGLLMVFTKRSFQIRDRKTLFAILGVGVLVGLHWVTFFKAIHLSTASFGILCLSTATFHVAWIEPLIMKRKPVLSEFVFSILIILGVYYVSGDLSKPDKFYALLIGMASALFASLFTVFNAKLVQKSTPIQMTFYEMLSATVVLSVIVFFQGDIQESLFKLTLEDIGWLMFLGVVCTSLAFLIVIEVVKYIGAFTASLTINLEPVYTILLAIPYLNEHEKLDAKFYIGAGLITLVVIANGVVKSVRNKKEKKKLARR